jgi:hypothetical protein
MEISLPNAGPTIGDVMERRAGLDLCTASRKLLLVSLSTKQPGEVNWNVDSH